MSRSKKNILSSKKHTEKDWSNPTSGRKLCTCCGHRQCGAPTTIDGKKALSKCKGTHASKRYRKTNYEELEEDKLEGENEDEDDFNDYE